MRSCCSVQADLDSIVEQGRLNSAIADWLLERRKLEAQYSNGLRKLAQRQLDGVDLGVFSVPWTTLTGSADTLADSHAALAIKIETDVEQPLRNFASTNREMTQISTIQGNLAALAKDVERATQKTDKLRGKGDKAEAGKVATANSDLDSAQQQWETQAPYVFESLQSLDETRLNHLREVLTQYQTHEVDQVERDRITAEQCLTVLLNVETSDEIKSFAQRAPQMRPALPPSRSHRNSIATPSRSVQPPAASPGHSALQPTIFPSRLTMTESGLFSVIIVAYSSAFLTTGLDRMGASTGASSVTALTRPHENASEADTVRPVSAISMAR